MLTGILMSWSLATGLLAPQTPTSAPVPAVKIDVESFVPAEALFVARVRSIDDLNRLVRAFDAKAEGEPQDDVMAWLKMSPPFQAQWDAIDRTKPVVLAIA